jgi:hypothetical protein
VLRLHLRPRLDQEKSEWAIVGVSISWWSGAVRLGISPPLSAVSLCVTVRLVVLLLQVVGVQIAYLRGYVLGAAAEYSSLPLNSRSQYEKQKLAAISRSPTHLVVQVSIRSTSGDQKMSVLSRKRSATRQTTEEYLLV